MFRFVASVLQKIPFEKSIKQRTRRALQRSAAAVVDSSFTEQDCEAPLQRSEKIPLVKRAHIKEMSLKRGAEIAFQARSMSDGEWEAVSLPDKHAFTRYISQQLRQAPAEVTEQQRRRFYETTLSDPRDDDPNSTVSDNMQRLKLGFPIKLARPERQLGVTQAIHDEGDAALFDPHQAHKIENAMTHVKQRFVDYVKKKREGLSTESERRALSKMSEELNYNTQVHLAHMFKHAEKRIRDEALKEKRNQLKHISALRAALKNRKKNCSQMILKRKRIQNVLRNTFGIDLAVAKTIWRQLKLQEDFLQLCEVMARMTVGYGFHHTGQDEPLEEYASSLRHIYSMNPEMLAKVDAVQFSAAVDGVSPIDWAHRYFQRVMMLPLRQMEEFRELEKLGEEAGTYSVEEGEPTEPTETTEPQKTTADLSHRKVVNLVENMFLPPNDERLRTLHEKRLQYLAFVQMESQIAKLRKNAQIFAGAENSPEAEQCRELYKQLVERKAFLNLPAGGNPFEDEVARDLLSQIQVIAKSYIHSHKPLSAVEKRQKVAKKIISAVQKGGVGRALQESAKQHKKALMQRILQLMERDVREDVSWAETLEEGDRPPPLPVPEPMSYVSAADVNEWNSLREAQEKNAANPFYKPKATGFRASFLGQPWKIPDKPLLFWGTGVTALQQALQQAVQDASSKRQGEELPPPYPCPENPWGWRLANDILDVD